MSEAVTNAVRAESAPPGVVRADAKKRVLFLINSLAGGGAERVMCTLLRHSEAERDAFEIILALLDNEPSANSPPDWVEVHQLDCAKSTLRSVLAVRKLFEEIKPDITVSFLTRANVANTLSARRPCIISERANTTAHFPRTLAGLLSKVVVRVVYPRAERVIAVSGGVAEDLRDHFGVRPARIVTIPNPVDAEVIGARADEPPSLDLVVPYILAAGRLVRAKNFEMLIQAFALSGIGGALVIAGEGPERENLIQTAHDQGVADRVVFPGFVSNPYPLMRRAHTFVLSSNAEGFPNALVEAMSLGVPVIATNCASGPSEILADAPRESVTRLTFAEHGVLTPTNDAASMAEALRALQYDERRRVYAERAKARALAFSAVVATQRYWAVVSDTLATRA